MKTENKIILKKNFLYENLFVIIIKGDDKVETKQIRNNF